MTDGVCPFAEWIPGVQSFTSGNGGRVGFCDHTAGGFMSTMRRADFWNSAGVSTHFAIGRDGTIIQMVNIFNTAFAQGRLGPTVTWLPYEAMGRENPNSFLISTEHEDAEIVDGRTRFIPGSEWTPEQYEADLRVKRWCVEDVRRVMGADLLRFGIDSLAGHHMFDGVNRAECPGRFWRNEYRARLFADLTGGGDEVYVPYIAAAQWFENRRWDNPTPPGQFWTMQATSDLSLPPDAQDVLLAVYLNGGELTFFHGGTAVEAGVAGWGNVRYQQIRARLASDGTLNFRAETPGTDVARIISLGYFK